MCLTIERKVHKARFFYGAPIPLIAHEDILVYKLLQRNSLLYDDIRTPYMNMCVEFNNEGKFEYEAKMDLRCIYGDSVVNDGCHSFGTLKSAIDHINSEEFQFVCPAIIPKGTKFFIGNWGDVVSEKLVLYSPKTECSVGIELYDYNKKYEICGDAVSWLNLNPAFNNCNSAFRHAMGNRNSKLY